MSLGKMLAAFGKKPKSAESVSKEKKPKDPDKKGHLIIMLATPKGKQK